MAEATEVVRIVRSSGDVVHLSGWGDQALGAQSFVASEYLCAESACHRWADVAQVKGEEGDVVGTQRRGYPRVCKAAVPYRASDIADFLRLVFAEFAAVHSLRDIIDGIDGSETMEAQPWFPSPRIHDNRMAVLAG